MTNTCKLQIDQINAMHMYRYVQVTLEMHMHIYISHKEQNIIQLIIAHTHTHVPCTMNTSEPQKRPSIFSANLD